MSAKHRLVKWRFPTKQDGRSVRVSTCGNYELIETPSPKTGSLWTVTFRPELRGTFDFRVLFVERTEASALDLLDAFEAERRNQEAKAA